MEILRIQKNNIILQLGVEASEPSTLFHSMLIMLWDLW